MAKKKFPKIVLPAATAAYAWIGKPDEGNSKYSDGKFKVRLVWPEGTEFPNFEELSKEAAKKEWGKVPKTLKLPFRNGSDLDEKYEDKDEDNPFEGMVFADAKSKYQPATVNSAREKIRPSTIWSGDLIKASVILLPYELSGKKGISLMLRAIQLLEKRASEGGDDFEDESDEYDAYASSGGDNDTDTDDDEDSDGDF